MEYYYLPGCPRSRSPTAAGMPRLVLTDALLSALRNGQLAEATLLWQALSRQAPEQARQLAHLLPAT